FNEEIINGGEYFPSNYDKPHSFNLVANYKFTRRLSFSFNLNYSTGRPVTYPVSAYYYKGTQFVQYSNRNFYRIPDYFRIDAGFNLEAGHKIKKLTHNYWSFSIYNVLGRDNPFSVFFDIQEGKIQGYQLIIFGSSIPTISYNFRI
ncbi:MAG: TonB-dependent receptor, partial [Cyclobacteriaceae bacterium]|nr:TonB-dependent receptor [Cyclobacteriaceae bacterium]